MSETTATPDWLEILQTEAVRFLADAIPGPVSYLDREYRYQFVNSHYAELLAKVNALLPADQVIGRTPAEIYPPEMARSIEARLARAISGEKFTVEASFRAGRTLNSFFPHVVNGEVVGTVLIAQDISDIHATRLALVQAERMASLGRIVAGMLHELNTPAAVLKSTLATLSTGLEKLGKEGGTEESRARTLERMKGLVTVADEATDRIASMSARLRTFARLDEAEVQDANLEEGMDSALAMLGDALAERITVHRGYAGVPKVHCRPAEINQVFLALLTNAIDAIQGAGEITVRSGVEGDRVLVSVSDTGVGIEPERLETLFEPVFSTGASRVKAGLGLFVSRSIAEQHRGELFVESVLGEGSTFTLAVPVSAPSDG